MYAACTDQLDIVELLIEAGADINAQTPQGETALFWAADQGKTTIYNYLANRTDDNLRQEVEEYFSKIKPIA